MKKLTAEEIKNLKPGTKVSRFCRGSFKTLVFVGPNPTSENLFVFTTGDHVENLFISPRTGDFQYDWYLEGERNCLFSLKTIVGYYESKIRSVKKFYAEDVDPFELEFDICEKGNMVAVKRERSGNWIAGELRRKAVVCNRISVTMNVRGEEMFFNDVIDIKILE